MLSYGMLVRAFILSLFSVLLIGGVTPTWAGGGWSTVATVTAGGDAKEVSFEGSVSKVVFACKDGSVTIHTVVVRDGEKKTPHTVGTTITKGQSQPLTVGDSIRVTGFRISDSGKGTYEVRIKP